MNTYNKELVCDILDCCVFKHKCNHCNTEFTLTLTDVYKYDLKNNLIYICPKCKKKFYLNEIHLKDYDE